MRTAFFVYILASKRNGTLYVGVTSNLIGRVMHHREGTFEGFTKRYRINKLVRYEVGGTMETAIGREKTIKKWPLRLEVQFDRAPESGVE